jgi:hypothetical protein
MGALTLKSTQLRGAPRWRNNGRLSCASPGQSFGTKRDVESNTLLLGTPRASGKLTGLLQCRFPGFER